MAYKFTENRKHTQEETAYIAYMIIGSWFKKVRCSSQGLLLSLDLFYRDMTERKQMTVESNLIRLAEEAMGKAEDSIFSQMYCEVTISRPDGRYCLNFYTGFESVKAVVDENGRCTIEVIDKAV